MHHLFTDEGLAGRLGSNSWWRGGDRGEHYQGTDKFEEDGLGTKNPERVLWRVGAGLIMIASFVVKAHNTK